MKLKYRILQNQRLYSVFQALMQEKMPLKAAYKMKRFADKLDQETKSYQTFMQDALKKYAELDEKGNPVIEFQGEGEEKTPVGYKLKDSATFQKEAEDFLDTEFEVEVNPLYASELDEVKIAPVDLVVMEPFIADINNI